MQMQITARHFDAPPSLKDYVAEKLNKLERYYDGITDVRVVLTEDGSATEGKSVEVILRVYRQTITANCDGTTHEEATDQCIEAVRRQIKKYKAKLRATDKHYQR